MVGHLCRWVPPPDGMPFLTNVPFTIQSTEDPTPHPTLLSLHAKQKGVFNSKPGSKREHFFLKRHPSGVVRVWKSITGWLVFLRTRQSFFSQPEFPGARAWLLHSGLVTDRKSRSILRPAPRSVRQRLWAGRRGAGRGVPTDCFFSGCRERGLRGLSRKL